jgi:predicted DsbA family dithiol-disulfide isomerase
MGPENTARVCKHIKHIGAAEGIRMAQGGVVGGTALCHVLMYLAGTISADQQTKVAEELFRDYFEEEKDIFNVPNLVEIGVAAGMERSFVEKGLNDEKAMEEVRKEEREIKGRGFRGVPRYFMGDILIEGAKDSDEFFESLLEIKEGKKE